MTLYESLPAVPNKNLVLAVGAFDGLHLGHEKVLQTTRALASKHQAQSGVLRFFPHSAKVLIPESAPHLLGTEKQLLERFEALGLDLQLRLPFTLELSKQEPEAFLEDLFQHLPRLKGMVVGSNWRFGAHGRGDFRLLLEMATAAGVEVLQAEDIESRDVLISSTRIRQAIRDGHMDAAARLLGRPYQLTGMVQSGKKIGRTLGFPTANISPGQECLPPPGVYAMRVGIESSPTHLGAGYITHNPPLCEVHLLDFEGDLYDKEIQVDLLSYERAATPIPDLEKLRARIQLDIQKIRNTFS